MVKIHARRAHVWDHPAKPLPMGAHAQCIIYEIASVDIFILKYTHMNTT